MYYGNIKYFDIANGVGVRTTLFVSGCRNHCEGCFQPETWNFKYGKEFTKEVEDEIIESLKPPYVVGLTLLGGDPFEKENQEALYPFIKRVKELYPNKNIWAYTGYVYDKDLVDGGKSFTEYTIPMLDLIDVLVDGPFILAEKDLILEFRGSRNQRVIDLNKTREQGEVVLYEFKKGFDK